MQRNSILRAKVKPKIKTRTIVKKEDRRLIDNDWLRDKIDEVWPNLKKGYKEARHTIGYIRGMATFSRVSGEESIYLELRGLIDAAERIIQRLYQ
jgi:hypothetical protein